MSLVAVLPSLTVCLCVCVHVNELLIRNESESQGGSLTDRVEELLKGEFYLFEPGCHRGSSPEFFSIEGKT